MAESQEKMDINTWLGALGVGAFVALYMGACSAPRHLGYEKDKPAAQAVQEESCLEKDVSRAYKIIKED